MGRKCKIPKIVPGAIFGAWTSTGRVTKKNRVWYVECRCKCGTVRFVDSNKLKKGESKSCGCEARKKWSNDRTKDMVGQWWGNWEVIAKAPSKNGRAHWVVRCLCGTVKVLQGNYLRSGQSLSCGCIGNKESLAKARISLLRPKFERRAPYNLEAQANLMLIDAGETYLGLTGVSKAFPLTADGLIQKESTQAIYGSPTGAEEAYTAKLTEGLEVV